MSNIRFVWDTKKAEANLRKHGVPFEEARSVFYDEDARLTADPDHSLDERRFVTFGMSSASRLLAVAHTGGEAEIRIISARPVTLAERKLYEEG